MSLMIEQHDAGKVTVLHLTGRLTQDTAGHLRDAVHAVIARHRGQILIDFSQVTYLDSCGLGELLQVYVTLRRRGGHVKLLNVTPPCRQLLTIARVLTVLEVFESEQLAIKSFPPNPVPLPRMN